MVSEHSLWTYPKEKFKLKHIANCMFLPKKWGGERLGRPILSPLHCFLTFQFICQSFGLKYSYTEFEHSWLTYPKEKFKLQAFSQMILLNRGVGNDWAGPFSPPPPPLQYVTSFLFIFTFTQPFHCIWALMMIEICEGEIQVCKLLILLNV